MAWRLFSGGLDGMLTEWDLTTLCAVHTSDSFGGAVWSMTAEAQQGNLQTVTSQCAVDSFLCCAVVEKAPAASYGLFHTSRASQSARLNWHSLPLQGTLSAWLWHVMMVHCASSRLSLVFRACSMSKASQELRAGSCRQHGTPTPEAS